MFVGPRNDAEEKSIAVNYVRHAVELQQMSEGGIAAKFNLELTRASRYFPKQSEAARSFLDMHVRHGKSVYDVLVEQIQRHAGSLIDGKLDKTSLLGLMAGQQHLTSSWRRYADRIYQLLLAGVPVACATNKPKTEPDLQEICDGILKAQDNDLVREFPFLRWSSSATKPDWSNEDLLLWIELKYVRKRSDIRPISDAIATDITKYGDNERRVLFVVYDPCHLILDEQEFSKYIVQRESMFARFIR